MDDNLSSIKTQVGFDVSLKLLWDPLVAIYARYYAGSNSTMKPEACLDNDLDSSSQSVTNCSDNNQVGKTILNISSCMSETRP